MGKIFENIVIKFSDIFYGKKNPKGLENEKQMSEVETKYTLSSVFPSSKIMIEVEKYLVD